MFILNKPSNRRLNDCVANRSTAAEVHPPTLMGSRIFRRGKFVAKTIAQLFNRSVYPAICLSILFTGYFLFQIHRLISDQDWLDHSDRAIGQAVLLQKLMLDAETGIRGYLLTNADVTLNPFREQSSVFARSLAETESIVRDNEQQVEFLHTVDHQFGIWATQAHKLVIAPQSLPAHAKKIFRQRAITYFGLGEGRLVMDRCRRAIDAFLSHEQSLRETRAAKLRREISRAIASGAAVTLLLRVLGVFILHQLRQLRRVKNANAAGLST